MTSPTMTFLWGAISMGCVVASVFFLKFYRQTRDRLFAMFAVGFFTFSLNWTGLALAQPSDETRHYFYLLRLAAFLLILAGVVDKNWPRRKR